MKNILITDGNGFIGSNFIVYMVNKYPNINFYNYDCNNYCSSKKNTEEIDNKIIINLMIEKYKIKSFYYKFLK